MRDNGLLILILCCFVSVMIFVGHFDIEVNGSITVPEVEDRPPGLLGIIDYCWTGLGFFFQLLLFQVPGTGPIIAWIFVIVFIILIWILLKWVRGTTTGA